MSISIEKAKEMQINKPSDYERLKFIDKLLLNMWIVDNLQPHKIKSFGGPTSYRLKHIFVKSPGGFYVSNGAIKQEPISSW